MKRKNKYLLIFLLPVVLFSACLMIVDLTINQTVQMDLPETVIPMLPLISTNIFVEISQTNESKDAIGQLVEVKELRLDYTLTNYSSNEIFMAVGISTNYTDTNMSPYIFLTNDYVGDPDQTAFIVEDVTISPYGSVSDVFVSTSGVNPVVINALLYSDIYSFIMKTGVENTNLVLSSMSLEVGLEMQVSLAIEKEVNDMPNIVSLFQ